MDRQNSYPSEKSLYPAMPMTVKELPQEMRPREEFLRRGASNVTDEILLAIILRSGVPGKNVTEMARELLRRCGGLATLCRKDFHELRGMGIKGMGKVKCMEMAAALEISRRVAEHNLRHDRRDDEPAVRTPESAYAILAPLARSLNQEIFWVLLLNTKNRVIGQPVETTRGLLDSSPVHPREVFSQAIRYNAAAVILAHNHPSGDPTPSKEDIDITRRMIEAARIIGIRVVDHLIVGKPSETAPGYVSLREQNLIQFA
ncbi:MAG: DNA repair protein RadC [Kiritimatiellae bacterium]|nr:DNA repair protein RadC [Kiritimatiellia bacterium]MDD4025163.1 DNA repair protein RadC [Kiritimatiellia bacterium]MDD4622783.1 DNA repair protein RadC [Kiritimatiellia bacterium]